MNSAAEAKVLKIIKKRTQPKPARPARRYFFWINFIMPRIYIRTHDQSIPPIQNISSKPETIVTITIYVRVCSMKNKNAETNCSHIFKKKKTTKKREADEGDKNKWRKIKMYSKDYQIFFCKPPAAPSVAAKLSIRKPKSKVAPTTSPRRNMNDDESLPTPP